MVEVVALTPTPGGREVVLPWPGPGGAFSLTVRLARVAGRTVVVGLDVRQADPGAPVPVDHPVLRGLQAGRIAEEARVRLAALLAEEGTPAALARLSALTMPDAPRAGAVRQPGDRVQRAAELWLAAVAAGGDRARRPAVYVHQQLVQGGEDVSLAAVRGRLHRARVKGLLGPQA